MPKTAVYPSGDVVISRGSTPVEAIYWKDVPYQTVSLTPEEARALYRQLDEVFGSQQPHPKGGDGDVWQELIDALPDEPYSPHGRLKAACVVRRELGIRRYGQPVRRGDGRDRRRDIVEELLDAAVYCQAAFGGELHIPIPMAMGLLEQAATLLDFVSQGGEGGGADGG